MKSGDDAWFNMMQSFISWITWDSISASAVVIC